MWINAEDCELILARTYTCASRMFAIQNNEQCVIAYDRIESDRAFESSADATYEVENGEEHT